MTRMAASGTMSRPLPGTVDLTLRGNIRDYVDVYLGHTKWRDVAGTALQFDGDLQIARAFPVWLRFETVNRGRIVNARSGAGKHGGKPRKIGEGRATRSGGRPGVSSSTYAKDTAHVRKQFETSAEQT